MVRNNNGQVGLCARLCAKPCYRRVLLNSDNHPGKSSILCVMSKKMENNLPTQSGLTGQADLSAKAHSSSTVLPMACTLHLASYLPELIYHWPFTHKTAANSTQAHCCLRALLCAGHPHHSIQDW